MSSAYPDDEFQALLGVCSEISQYFREGLTFIGGIAVYLHATNHSSISKYAEATHDGDFYISLADLSDLRDIEEVTPNRRLNKHQIIKKGFEFDIYTEHQSKLIIPYDRVIAHSVQYGDIKVAGLEELIGLKMEAYRDRRNGAKGRKDAKDLFRIAMIAEASRPIDFERLALYLNTEHIKLLDEIYKSPASVELAFGNAVQAKQIRLCFQKLSDGIKKVPGVLAQKKKGNLSL